MDATKSDLEPLHLRRTARCASRGFLVAFWEIVPACLLMKGKPDGNQETCDYEQVAERNWAMSSKSATRLPTLKAECRTSGQRVEKPMH